MSNRDERTNAPGNGQTWTTAATAACAVANEHEETTMKKIITANYSTPSAEIRAANRATIVIEAQRRAEEERRNDRRFLRHNAKRRELGLPRLDGCAYLERKYRAAQCIEPCGPVHRDDVTLLVR